VNALEICCQLAELRREKSGQLGTGQPRTNPHRDRFDCFSRSTEEGQDSCCAATALVPMVVEESRILQVSIFRTLQRNLGNVDFSKVLLDVVTIADEVDSQLKQALSSFVSPRMVLNPLIRLAG